MELTPRLKLVYGMLGGGDTLIDVGTDHAYLPIKLVADGKYSRAVASDIAKGPLASARENIAAAGLDGKIETALSDGFESVALPDGGFSVAVCGMGGEMIASVLSSSEEISRRAKLLVLQPMTKDEKLREYLWKNGFEILEERAASEGEKVYIAMAAHYTGERVEYTEEELYVGKADALAPSDDMERRLEKIFDRYTKIWRASGEEKYHFLAEAAKDVLELLRRKR